MSTAVPQSRPAAAPPSAVEEWARIAVASTARTVLAVLCGSVVWAVAPTLLGWHATTVMTGSMEPRIRPGDVVVSRPLDGARVRAGQVALFADPDHPGRLRLHRVVGVHGGVLTTRGDANPQADPGVISTAAVEGVGVLRVPSIGWPVLWARDGELVPVLLAACAVVGLLLLAGLDRAVRRRDAGGAHPAGTAAARAIGLTSIVVATALTTSLVPAQPASAEPFRAATTGDAGWTAAAAVPPADLACTNSGGSSVTISWAYGGAAPQSFDLLSGDAVLATTSGSARSVDYSRTALLALGSQYPLRVRTNLAGTWSATSSSTTTVTVTAVAGLTVVRCA